MGLFNRKRRVQLEDFCREFYDQNLLPPAIRGVDLGEIYFRAVQKSIAEMDGGFATIDSKQILAEMTIIRFEVFALAWLHQFGDKRAPDQSAYTKSYLGEKGRQDIWANMEPYNQAIARSSTAGCTCETGTGRAYLAFVNKMRADLFDQWYKRGFEPDSVARAVNRISVNAACDNGVAAGFLMYAEHV